MKPVWRRLLGGAAVALAGASAAASSGFEQALEATAVGQRPAGAYFLVPLLAAQGQPERAEQLRRELWRLQLERLQGAEAPPARTVGQLVTAGAQLPPLAESFAPAWEYAYNVALGLTWPRSEAADERLRITLTNRAPDPLPLVELRLRLGSEASGVTLPCHTDPAPADIHAASRQAVEPGRAVDLVCEAPADARSRALLPVLVGAARDGGEPPRLLPAGLRAKRPQPDQWLWQFWGRVDDPLAAWQRRWKTAQRAENTGRTWQAATWPDPPALQPLPPTLSQRIGARSQRAWDRGLPLLIIGGVGWVLFFGVRLSMRRAALAAQSLVCLAAALAVSLLYLVVSRGSSHFGGDGWSRWGELGVWLGVMSLGMSGAVLAILMLRLHRLLDDEGRSWGQAIADGWRRALQLGGTSTSGQFWGFVAFAVWAWGLASPWGQPWNQAVLAALGLPLITVSLRRLASLTVREFAVLVLMLLLLVVDYWL